MSALERVQAGGRGLERRLDSVPAEALLAGLRAAGAVSEPEVAALGAPGGPGWVRRLRALAVARGDRTCRVLLDLLAELEGPPQPGPFDFYNPQRDAEPGHRSDCPCCRPEPGWTRRQEEEEEEQGEAKEGDEGPEEEEGGPKDEDGDEGPEDEDGGGDEGPEEEDGDGRHEDGDEGPEEEDGGPEDEDGDGRHEDGDEGPEDGGKDEGPEDEDGGGDEGPEDGDEGPEDEDGGGDEGNEDGGGEEE
ncbi:S-antigen protein-like [Corvus kubaryi]|uniref:S-antigen protein-like n=1 Tax=Corvus kubaryi TaxID=68294 RepID=UPI001C04FE0D|nr:S-antigen protein-like [Corvus kubaryi]